MERVALRLARELAILRGSMRGEARVLGYRVEEGERWAGVLVVAMRRWRGVSVVEREAVVHIAAAPVGGEDGGL